VVDFTGNHPDPETLPRKSGGSDSHHPSPRPEVSPHGPLHQGWGAERGCISPQPDAKGPGFPFVGLRIPSLVVPSPNVGRVSRVVYIANRTRRCNRPTHGPTPLPTPPISRFNEALLATTLHPIHTHVTELGSRVVANLSVRGGVYNHPNPPR
jgi:hypothetical protein